MKSAFPSIVPQKIFARGSTRPAGWGHTLVHLALGWFGLTTAAWADTAPTISQYPASQTVEAGQTVTFTVVATGTAPLSYQWYAGANPISGATSDRYVRANVQPDDAGVYSVAVSNAAGTVRTFNAFDSAFSAGYSHKLMVKADGSLWVTGQNNYGKLGDGSLSSRYVPEQVAIGVAKVAAGSAHSLFLKTDGTLWACGYNAYGQLGDGSTTNQATPVPIATGVSMVVAGAYHSLFLKTDGTLWGMGSNYDGQLGDGTTAMRYAPVQIASGVSSAAAGGYHTLFVKTDGTMWATGYNGYGQLAGGLTYRFFSPSQVATNVATVAAGANHTLFVKTDGSLWTAGNNNYGQLGNGSTSYYYYNNVTAPNRIASGVQSVSANGDFSLYRRTDDTLWGMGNNSNGQLGDAASTTRASPIPVLCTGDNPAVLTVILPPVISMQPASQVVGPGVACNLSVTASGSSPLYLPVVPERCGPARRDRCQLCHFRFLHCEGRRLHGHGIKCRGLGHQSGGDSQSGADAAVEPDGNQWQGCDVVWQHRRQRCRLLGGFGRCRSHVDRAR